MKKANKKRIIMAMIIIMVVTMLSGCSEKEQVITYLDGVEAVEHSLIGFDEIKEGVVAGEEKESEYYINSLKFISSYMSTKDKKYLEYAKNGAEYVRENINDIGIVDVYEEGNIAKAVDQATMSYMISYLAMVDDSYKDLMIKLADGIANNFINKENNLVWSKVDAKTGKPINDSNYGYESQFGNSTLKCAQALLVAYKFQPEKKEYKDIALDIINSIWERRDRETNLISESWDVLEDKPGTKMYPYTNFRYDDMGGVYIRTLILAYNLTYDDEIMDILKIYTPALVNGVWDESINGGAFRYLNSIKGQTSSVPMIETMYGLFTATLIEASILIDNKEVLNKCIENAENILVDGFGLKNNMVPHALDNDGNYLNVNSDSQLGYAVIQFPLGYNMLSNVTGNKKYRDISNEIIKTFLERHKVHNGDIPTGYADKLETQEPFGLEEDYTKSGWMSQIAYLPFYLLYNSIQLEGDTKINWEFSTEPNVLGLANDIPIWDTDLVSMDLENKTLKIKEVSGKGKINLEDIGLGKISKIFVDGEEYSDFKGNEINIKDGTHSYEIRW